MVRTFGSGDYKRIIRASIQISAENFLADVSTTASVTEMLQNQNLQKENAPGGDEIEHGMEIRVV